MPIRLPPVPFAARIGLIVVFSLTMVWLGVVVMFNMRWDGGNAGLRPPPDQLAAIAALIEATPPAARDTLLRGVSSDTLHASIASPGQTADHPAGHPPLSPGLEIERRSLAEYRATLAPRPVALSSQDRRAVFPAVARLFPNALEFRIGLTTGETLVIVTRSAVPVTIFGLPQGLGAGLFGTLIALLTLFIMHRETKPLARLAGIVDRMNLDGAPVLLPETHSTAPEIRALVGAFNRLQNRLAGLLKARMAMFGGISHDVRTFATRLRLRVDLIPAGPDRDRAIADIADMIRLLDDALLASRAGAAEMSEELLDLACLIRADVTDRQTLGQPVTLTTDPGPIPIIGDRLALRRIFANLIDNALKYGHAARIRLTTAADTARIEIDDDGPGIAPDMRDILLEPFTRLEHSRNRHTGGAGLGLAVVRSLIEAQGGTVAITAAPSGGARLALTLKLFRDLGLHESLDETAQPCPDPPISTP